MATYSLGLTGVPADNPTQPASLDVDDEFGRVSAMPQAMSENTPFLCQRPDGSQRWYTYDAERSNPAIGLRVLKRV